MISSVAIQLMYECTYELHRYINLQRKLKQIGNYIQLNSKVSNYSKFVYLVDNTTHT